MTEHILQFVGVYRYLLIIPLAIVEGPVLALVCGFFLKLGTLSLVPVFLALMVGDMVSDTYWYYIGKIGGRRLILKYGKFFSITDEQLAVAEKLYQRHYAWILFLSKITMGFGFAIAIVAVAGVVRVPFKKYMLVNILSQPIWTGTLLLVGYVLGSFYTVVDKGLQWAFLAACIVIIGALVYGFTKYMRARMLEKYR